MGRTKKIYEWLKDILWIINRQKDKDYIKINEKINIIKKNISTIIDGKIRHDPYMIAESAIKLICNDMKYQDKESDPTYIMLNAKLQSDKRISKLKKEKRKRDKRAEKRGINPNTKNKTKSLKNVLQYTEGYYRTMQKGEALRLPLKY